MYLHTIIAFALVFFHGERQVLSFPLFGARETVWTLIFVGAQFLLTAGWAVGLSRRFLRRFTDHPEQLYILHHRYHRAQAKLRWFIVGAFAAMMLLTRWPVLCYELGWKPHGRIMADVLVLSPYFIGAVLIWVFSYPVERAMKDSPASIDGVEDHGDVSRWNYLLFNVRHHILIVGLPMLLVLFAANLTRGYARELRRWAGGWPLAPDFTLGAAAFLVFLISPVLLCRVWKTEPLPDGALRARLERLCERIGLRRRQILLWKSDRMMINAAVMGAVGPLRYVLLSDGLLDAMDERQVEAVFGHEAGHVRYHHMECFLLFAVVTMLTVSGVVELLLRWGPEFSASVIEGTGAMLTLAFWILGFGYLSRQFERQADVFGAACVTPQGPRCEDPCSVHAQTPPRAAAGDSGFGSTERLCSTAVKVFASALDRVALLNGIEPEEPGWRHPSIASRIRFLTALANDPGLARRFHARMRWMKRGLVILASAGVALAIYLCVWGDLLILRTVG